MAITQGFPIEIVQGADFYWPITYQDQNSVAINLTGYTAQMQVRQTINSNNPPIIDVSTSNGYITIIGATGQVNINIPNSLTSLLTAPINAYYDVFITSPSGFKTRIIYGTVSIPERVTR